MPADNQMYRYIVKDAMDDIQDVADGIKELVRITGDPKLAEFQNELRNMRGYLNRMLGNNRGNAVYPDIRSPELLGLEQSALEQMEINKEREDERYNKRMRAKPFLSGVYIVGDKAYKFDTNNKTVEFYRHINTYEDYPTLLNNTGYGYDSLSNFLLFNPSWHYED